MLIQFSRLWISRDDWRSLMSISGRGSALDSEAARAELLQRLVTAQEDERYSRLFPDRTPDQAKPQSGRLNKSPHTIHAFANPHKFINTLRDFPRRLFAYSQ